MLHGMLQQRIRFLVLSLVLLFSGVYSRAETVSVKLNSKITATANFHAGDKTKPAILMMHGFLQTREFAIVKSMSDELATAGYTVLAPTLSLGITHRKKSLDCEALHLHSINSDIEEIQRWVQWLRDKGYKKIVGFGHSFGGTQLLAWAAKYPHADFELIAISLVGSMPQIQRNKTAAPAQRKRGEVLLTAPLSFCNRYTAPASNYFSYLDWHEPRILHAIRTAAMPVHAILGSSDNRLIPGWEAQIRQAGADVHVVKGANHFMDGTHEFDVLEIALGILKQPVHRFHL